MKSLVEVESIKQDLTFKQLLIYYDKNNCFKENYSSKLKLFTDDNKYNHLAYLLADKNDFKIRFTKYDGLNKEHIINI